jgi:hypothetical protein
MNQIIDLNTARQKLTVLKTSPEKRSEAAKSQSEINSIEELIDYCKQSPTPAKKVDVSYKPFDETKALFHQTTSEEQTINLMNSDIRIIEHEGTPILYLDNTPVHPRAGINSLGAQLHFNPTTYNKVEPDTKLRIINDLKQDRDLHMRILRDAQHPALPDPTPHTIKGFYPATVSTITGSNIFDILTDIRSTTEGKVELLSTTGHNPFSHKTILNFILPETCFEAPDGLPVFVGYRLQYSDINRAELDIACLLMQARCTNMAVLKTKHKRGIFHASRTTTIDPTALQAVISDLMNRLADSSTQLAAQVSELASKKVSLNKELDHLLTLPIKKDFIRKVTDELKSKSPKDQNPKLTRWDILSVLTNRAQRYSGFTRSAIESSLSPYLNIHLAA